MIGLINKNLSIERASNAVHQTANAIFIATVGYIGGATAITGIINVWADQVLRKIVDWLPIPDDSILGRLFKLFEERHIPNFERLPSDLRTIILGQYISPLISQLHSAKWLLIDLDSTVKTVFGNQEGAEVGYNPHKKGAKSHHPLLAFCAISKTILQAWHRSGSAYTSNGVIGFVSQLMANIQEEVRPYFRADSGFFSGEFLDFLEKNKYGYLIKVKLKNFGKLMLKQHLWEPVSGRKYWQQCVFEYACGDWDKIRTFHAVRVKVGEKIVNDGLFKGEIIEQYEYFCYVCTDNHLSPWQIHKKYGQRATSENWIKEAKNHMALGHIKSDKFLATSALFHCSVLAYNLIRWMTIVSGSTRLFKWQLGTVRTFMVRVGGLLSNPNKRLNLKFSNKNLYHRELRIWMSLGSSPFF